MCRSDWFPHTQIRKSSCAYDCGRGSVSVDAFFFLLILSSSFFFSHPESCFQIEISVGKSRRGSGRGGEKKNKKTKNKKKR